MNGHGILKSVACDNSFGLWWRVSCFLLSVVLWLVLWEGAVVGGFGWVLFAVCFGAGCCHLQCWVCLFFPCCPMLGCYFCWLLLGLFGRVVACCCVIGRDAGVCVGGHLCWACFGVDFWSIVYLCITLLACQWVVLAFGCLFRVFCIFTAPLVCLVLCTLHPSVVNKIC